MAVHHYTDLKSGISILQDGYLEISDTEIKNNIKPALWFSKDTKYEPSALKSYIDDDIIKTCSSLESQVMVLGCMRFTYSNSEELIKWEDYLRESVLEISQRKIIEETYKKLGSDPSGWYCSFKNIPLKLLESIEVYTDKWSWANEDNVQFAIRKAKSLR